MWFSKTSTAHREVEWIAMKFGTDLHGSQRINPNDHCDLWLSYSATKSFYLSNEIFQHLLYEFCTDIHISEMMYPDNFGDPLKFYFGVTMRLWV